MEDDNMLLLYNIDISNAGLPSYNVDNTMAVGAFDRIAYHLELLHMEYGHQTVYVSMNPFSDDPENLGIPNKNAFDQRISNISLKSNVQYLPQGNHEQGHIEFSPSPYTPMEGSNKKIDSVGDKVVNGCMQIFIDGACVFAYNNFNSKFVMCDVGIGNMQKGKHRDWSFACNGGQYIKKTLSVFVKPFRFTNIIKEHALWKGCYSLDIPLLKRKIEYNFDLYNYGSHRLPFDRVGYLMYLGNSIASEQWIWVSMDAFTSQHCDITLPGLNGLVVNKKAKNLHIVSSVHGDIHLNEGHIRISPYDYCPGPSGKIGYDDVIMNHGEYGCFQIYDGPPELESTNALMSYNNFYSIPDIGIGNHSTENKNWTLAGNGHLYDIRRFEIMTRPCTACGFIPEIREMKLLYSIDLRDNALDYVVNNYEVSINRPFTRVGYYVELNGIWMFVSFDWHDIGALGIPTKSVVRFVDNATIKASDGTDVKSKSKVWIRFTPHDYNIVGPPVELLTGSYGCVQIGFKESVLLSISNLQGNVNAGFYGNELPVSTYLSRNAQVFVNRHDNTPDVVFLVTGQSNSQGTGGFFEPHSHDDAMDDNILSWNIKDKSWDVASLERTMGTKPLLSQCFGFHFAKKYIKRFPNTKIGLVVCGAPGQSICRWSHVEYPKSANNKRDTGDIFDKTVLFLKEALEKSKTRTVESILWHQGESDYNETNEYYRNRLRHVVGEYRRTFGKNVVFIGGEVLKCGNTHKQNAVLRELNHNNDVYTRCAFSKNLDHCGDKLHFNTQSHRDLGDMYFEQYMITQYMSILKKSNLK